MTKRCIWQIPNTSYTFAPRRTESRQAAGRQIPQFTSVEASTVCFKQFVCNMLTTFTQGD